MTPSDSHGLWDAYAILALLLACALLADLLMDADG